MADAWGQSAWADYSGVSRTLQSLSDEEVTAIVDAINGSEGRLMAQVFLRDNPELLEFVSEVILGHTFYPSLF